MPIMTLTAETGTASLGWSTTGAISSLEALASDDGLSSIGSSYVACSIHNRTITGLAVQDLGGSPDLPVAEEDIASITSVRFLGVGRMPGRGTSGAEVEIAFTTPSGYGETLNFFNNLNYEVEYGTKRTEKPDSSAWSYSDIEDLVFIITKKGTELINLSYFAVEVVYVEAAADNATFFGANF